MNTLTPHLNALAYAHGEPLLSARIRSCAEDFQVDEDLGFTPDGTGEHLFLHIRKRNTNTDWLARQLARFYGVKPMAVSYAGLKDRLAVTSQWFSVHLPKPEQADWQALNNEEIEVLQAVRSLRKLRRGALRGNRFVLTLRELQGPQDDLEKRLQTVRAVPNYFGAQRFGHEEGNLEQALAMFQGERKVKDRHKRGLYLSAARAFLFNRVLSARVADGSWQQALPGEMMQLDGSHSLFAADADDPELASRLAAYDIHPTGPLWGRGQALPQGECAALEQRLLDAYAVFREGLQAAGMEQERRALRLPVRELSWEFGEDARGGYCRVSFYLPAGAYASTVLREWVNAAE